MEIGRFPVHSFSKSGQRHSNERCVYKTWTNHGISAFHLLFAHYIIFPESPKADGKIGKK
jgi:hypothetical protein